MKYWVFQNNQVSGPYETEDLSQLAGYSSETLVCAEGRKGTNTGDWQRASTVPELSSSISKASQLTSTLKGAAGPSSLPPDPTLKDIAALGSLQERVSQLDDTVGHLKESLRLKEDELLSVHKELDEKSRHAQELMVKLNSLEERVSSVSALREGLDKAVAAEHDVEATVKRQSDTISELMRQLDAVKDEQARAQRETSQHRGLGTLDQRPPDLPKEAPVALAPPSMAMSAPPSMGISAPPSMALPMPFDMPAPAAAPAAEPPPLLPPEKKRSGKLVFVMLALALAAGAAGAYKMGLIPLSQKRAVADVEPPSAAPPMPTDDQASAPQPDLETQLEDQKKAAVDLARGWLLADGSTLSAKLETATQGASGLSPWMAERLRDNVLRVNFYAPKAGNAPAKTYEFEVLLAERQVVPQNAAALSLLNSKPVAASRPKRRQRAERKPMLEDLLSLGEESAPAPVALKPARRPRIRAKAPAPETPRDVNKDLNELLAQEDENPSKKMAVKDDQSLDELLLPGVPKRPGLDEPQAEPSLALSKPAPVKAPKKKKAQAADADLLDDLLKP